MNTNRNTNRETTMQIEQTDARPFVLIMERTMPGGWGRGKTLADALRAVRANGGRGSKAGANVLVCACDRRAYVDEMGTLFATSRGPIYNARVNPRSLTLLEEVRPAKDDPPA
jgi:hypothetical protein